MTKYKHVIQYFNNFTFRLTLQGERVLPGAWWPTRTAASFFAELSKHYIREKYGLDHHTVRMADHCTLDSLTAEASQRGIDISSPEVVFEYLPKGIKAHLERNRQLLENVAALSLNFEYREGVASVLSHLQSIVNILRRAAAATDGPKKEFLTLAQSTYEKDMADFEASALTAAKQPAI